MKSKDLSIKLLSNLFLKNCKGTDTEFSPVYFNPTKKNKTLINHQTNFGKSFQGILYRIDNYINEVSGWIVESIESKYINTSTFRPFIGRFYSKLLAELRNPKERHININNNDQKYFLWYYIGHINLLKIHQKRAIQIEKKK